MKDRRIGKFGICRDLIDLRPNDARAILRDVIVIHAEYQGHSDHIEYIGICPAFAAIDRGCSPPRYVAEVKGDAGDLRVKWVAR